MTPDALFFDLDGTLVDTEVLWLEAICMAMSDRGVELDKEASEKLVYGKSWADIFDEIDTTWAGLWLNRADMESVSEPYFRQLESERDITLPSSLELLKTLGDIHQLAIVSGSSNSTIAGYIQSLGLSDAVNFHLGCESYSPGKPSPTPYLMAAEIAKARPEQCIVFEDSWAGVQSAKDAGMVCVALKRAEAPDQDVSRADLVLTDLADFDLNAV